VLSELMECDGSQVGCGPIFHEWSFPEALGTSKRGSGSVSGSANGTALSFIKRLARPASVCLCAIGSGSRGSVWRHGIADDVRPAGIGDCAVQSDHDFGGFVHGDFADSDHFGKARSGRFAPRTACGETCVSSSETRSGRAIAFRRHAAVDVTARAADAAASEEVGVVPSHARWRNWQTHSLEVAAPERAWGSSPPLPHHKFRHWLYAH
jgi:hypothetical protein